MADGKYNTENISAIQKKYDQIGRGDRSFYLSSEVPLHKVPVGDQTIRILPAFEKGEFYGTELFVHEWIGMGKDAFLCLDKMGKGEGEFCPFCEQAKQLSKANATYEELQPFKPKKKYLLNIVDVNNEKDGVKVWIAPFTVVDEILLQSYDKKAKSPKDIADPDNGHDVFLTRIGEGRNTKYKIQIDQDNTGVDQSWLDNRFDLTSILIHPDLESMENALESMAGTVDVEKEARPVLPRGRSGRTPAPAVTTKEVVDDSPPFDTDDVPEVNLKDQIAKATAGKYSGATTGRVRA